MRLGNPIRYRGWSFVVLIMIVALVRAADAHQELPGLVVEEILTDSAAAKAGFKVGDRVMSYDGKSLPSAAALQAAEENTIGQAEVVLRIQREETLTLTAPPGKLGLQVRPELPPAALALYEEGRVARKGKKTDAIISQWKAAAKSVQEAGET